MKIIAELIKLAATEFDAKQDVIREGVTVLCYKFPLY